MQIIEFIKSFVKDNKTGLILIFLAWVAFFSRTLFFGQIYFLDDLKIIYYPLEQEYAHFQALWQLPQWSNLFGFGHPLIAWGQLGFLTPLHLFLRLLHVPPLILLQISIISYFGFGLCGMYVFLRKRLYSEAASALGAALFTFSGFSIGHLNHVNFYTSTMLLPWLLIAGVNILKRPTIQNAGLLALVAGAITLSGQPQVVLFTFIAAAGLLGAIAIEQYWPFIRQKKEYTALVKTIGYVVISGILAIALASFSILPLFEFLPQTERSAALPRSELLEFSYPPLHAITLVFPYFFGDHDHYWGAKGFQELAAFTGILPLLLAGMAFFYWRNHKPERIVGLASMLVGVVMATGKYSLLYSYLIQEQYITTLGVAGRFVFFFVIGILLLATTGLDDIAQYKEAKKLHRILPLIGGIIFIALIFTGFFFAIQTDDKLYEQLINLVQWKNPEWDFLFLGLLIIPLYAFTLRFTKWHTYATTAIASIAIATLVLYAWDYNPVTAYKDVKTISPFASILENSEKETGIPARIYSREDLIQKSFNTDPKKRTDEISPDFSVYQPFTAFSDDVHCLLIEMGVDEHAVGAITVGLHKNPLEAPLSTTVIQSEDITPGKSKVCFTPTSVTKNDQYWLSFTSTYKSGIFLEYQFTDNPAFEAYFTRKEKVTPQIFDKSQKEAVVLVIPDTQSGNDLEALLLARHLNVVANSSSARWIGALSIRPYREFIEFFFANDRDAIDGDGLHAIQRYRNFVNLTGITYLAQLLPLGKEDGMADAGYEQIASIPLGHEEARLYKNPQAAPKTFLVPNAVWKPADDETRAEMRFDTFDPFATAYLNGPTPPETFPSGSKEELQGSSKLLTYTPTYVKVETDSNKDAVVVVSDTTTPEWHTTIDGKPVNRLIAYSMLKAAIVPAGKHTVEFTYHSPAITKSKYLTSIAAIIIVLMIIYPILIPYFKKSAVSTEKA